MEPKMKEPCRRVVVPEPEGSPPPSQTLKAAMLEEVSATSPPPAGLPVTRQISFGSTANFSGVGVVTSPKNQGSASRRLWLCGCSRNLRPQPKARPQPCQLRLAQDFQRGDLLGAGSYGCVFAARRKSTGEIVAVKEMSLDRAGRLGEDRSERLVRLTRELRICEQLEHPYIVKYLGHEFVMGAQQGPQRLHLFLEYCGGGCLSAQLRTYGPLKEDLLRKYTLQLVTGLTYLHSRSPPVVHRDLKCANVLLTQDGDAKIADFGCSKPLQAAGETLIENSVAGSIFWMAPELIRGKVKLATSCDVWSLGCCVLEMSTGSPPWHERGFDNILQACHVIANTEELPPFPNDLTEEAGVFITACLRRNAQDRPTAAELQIHKFLGQKALAANSR